MNYLFKKLDRKKRMFAFVVIVILIIIGLIVFITNRRYKFPEEEDFLLTSSVSNKVLKVGDTLIAKGLFKNMSDRRFKLHTNASFSKSGLINIYVYKIDEEEMIFVGAAPIIDIGPKQEIDDEISKKMTETGKYKVVVSSNIEIRSPDNKEKREYNIKADVIYVEVE